jgi:hypothetical protein
VTTTTVTVTSTTYPYLTCENPSSCSGSFNLCSGSSSCYCVATPEGVNFCGEADVDCGPQCSSTSDCQPGYVCDINDCCQGVCVNAIDCTNPASPSRIFKRAEAAAAGAALNLPGLH